MWVEAASPRCNARNCSAKRGDGVVSRRQTMPTIHARTVCPDLSRKTASAWPGVDGLRLFEKIGSEAAAFDFAVADANDGRASRRAVKRNVGETIGDGNFTDFRVFDAHIFGKRADNIAGTQFV